MDDLSVTKRLEQIVEDFCSNYCKYAEKSNIQDNPTDDELDAFYEKYCYNCPLLDI